MTTIPKVDVTVGIAVAGGAVWAVHQAWTAYSPTLTDLRMSGPDDIAMHQQLLDTCVLVGGLALLAGGVISIATHNVFPVLIMGAAFGLLVYVHRSALTGPTPITTEE